MKCTNSVVKATGRSSVLRTLFFLTESVSTEPLRRQLLAATGSDTRAENIVESFSALPFRMFGKRFIYVVMLTNIVLLGDGRTIRDPNSNFDIINTAKALDEPANVYPGFKAIEFEELKNIASNDSCHGNCNEKLKAVNRNHLEAPCPYQSKELCLIFSLSKIAKVRAAMPSGASSVRELNLNVFDGAWTSAKSSRIDGRTKEERTRPRFSERTDDEDSRRFPQRQMKLSNVRCQAIRDVYIPEVEHSLPAFACRYGNNTFVLSSPRFLQDRRLYLDLKVNENIFKNIKPTFKISEEDDFNVVPALLILNINDNDYRVELDEHSLSELKVNETRKS